MKVPPAPVVIQQVLAAPGVRAKVEALAHEIEREAVGLAKERAFDQGAYANTIRVEPTPEGARCVAADPKSRWLEEGTGIHGPLRVPITPKKGRFLVFTVPSGETIFARSVKGRAASWVMRDAAKAVAERHGLPFANLRRFQG